MLENKKIEKLLFDKTKAEAFIRDNYEKIYKYCFYHLGNRELAQDITQEVFLKFIRNIDCYSEYGKLSNFLYVIARNTITDDFRKRNRLDISELAEEQEDDSGGQMDVLLERLSIEAALEELEKAEKEIVLLRYYQELKIRDIARILEMPASTVRYKLKKAEKYLKTRLEL